MGVSTTAKQTRAEQCRKNAQAKSEQKRQATFAAIRELQKALALGARAVLVDSPIIWGLAVDGAVGVQQVLSLLHAELERAMRLAGCPTLANINRTLVKLP